MTVELKPIWVVMVGVDRTGKVLLDSCYLVKAENQDKCTRFNTPGLTWVPINDVRNLEGPLRGSSNAPEIAKKVNNDKSQS